MRHRNINFPKFTQLENKGSGLKQRIQARTASAAVNAQVQTFRYKTKDSH